MRCPHCVGAKGDIVLWGWRYLKERSRVRRYHCNACRRTWCEDAGFKGKRKSEYTIVSVLSQYWKGLTSRELADEHVLNQKTVLAWVHEYATRLYAFLHKHAPQVTERLHVDELFLRMGNGREFHFVWDAVCVLKRVLFGFC